MTVALSSLRVDVDADTSKYVAAMQRMQSATNDAGISTQSLQTSIDSLATRSQRIQDQINSQTNATKALVNVQVQLAAANDNAAAAYRGANDDFQQFSKSLADRAIDFIDNVNHLKLMAVAAYAVSPAFRSFTNTEIQQGLQLIGVNMSLVAGAARGAVSALSPALSFFTRISIPIGLTVAAWEGFNAVVDKGSGLLQQYGDYERKRFDSNVTGNLDKLTRFQTDSISPLQIQNAIQLAARMADAKRTISDFWSVELDLTDPALKLQGAWVDVLETIAKALDKINGMPAATDAAAKAVGNSSIWNSLNFGWNLPGKAAVLNQGQGPDQSTAQALQLAKGRLAAGMGGGFVGRFSQEVNDLASPPKPQAPPSYQTNSYDRGVQSVRDQIDLLNLEAEGAGKTTQAYQELKIAHDLNIAAMKAGIEPTDTMRAEWKTLADQIADLTVKVNQAKAAQEEAFKGSVQFMTESDKAAATAAHQIDSTNWAAHLQDAGPRMAAFNTQLGQARDLTFDFTNDFTQGLEQGKSKTQALQTALQNLQSTLLQMVERNAINQIFSAIAPSGGSGFNLLSLLGIGSSGTNTGFASPTQRSAMGNVFSNGIPIHAYSYGGVVNTPSIFPMANGGIGLMSEAGPEAIMPLRRGPDGRLGVVNHGSGGVIVQHSTEINNYRGADTEIRQRNQRGPDGEKTVIDIVKKADARGDFDASRQALYGLRRRKVR